jgi:hypothetical protein
MKITKNQLRRIIREEKSRLTEMFDTNNIDMRATSFDLYDASGDVDVSGDLRDPVALRALADALEGLISGRIIPNGRVALDLN